MPASADTLRPIKSFDKLLPYLEEELNWPLAEYSFEDLTFEYSPAEVGLREEEAAKVRSIHQLRPLQHDQPWGIFFIEFERKRMPVVVLRRILSRLVVKKRASANRAQAAAWNLEDLLFISTYGEESSDQRELAFAHFHQGAADLPTLRVLGWDGADTPLKLEYVDATLRRQLRWPADPDDHDAWRAQWTPAFRHRIGHVIRTADSLAEKLAELARGIRDAAITLMAHETETGPLRRLHKAFQTALIHDLEEADFADTYAQTITYGLLTAAISRTEMSAGRYGTALVAGNVTDMVPITNPFLREMLETFVRVGGRQAGIDFDELGVQDVVELLRGDETDLPAVLRDFGNRTRGEDPVLHFYEHFLSAYNKELKIQRGVFYTPQPVVSYIVRSVHELLQSEFGLEDGLASTATWGEMAQRHPEIEIPEGTDPASPFVVILDPATGTGTFLVEVIEVIHRTLTAEWKRQGYSEAQQHGAWNEYVPQYLLPRLYGFELMMAPYAIAHMKLGLKLHQTGYDFSESERLRVYLTNTLEEPMGSEETLPIFGFFAVESTAAAQVKRHQAISVIVGNPPYAIRGRMNMGKWILGLIDDWKPQGEKKWNPDDFMKFIRWSQWRIERTGAGILALITNHSYLDGLTHRTMRQSLRDTFAEIYILDLHGSCKKKELSPDGSQDDNVFEIQTGVAVGVFVKNLDSTGPARLHHSDMWGLQDSKYNRLINSDVTSTSWAHLKEVNRHSCLGTFFFFTPKAFDNIDEYCEGWSVNRIFPVNQNAIKTDRDALFYDFERDALERKIRAFYSEAGEEPRFREEYGVRDSSSYDLLSRRSSTLFSSKNIHESLYRPFDRRWLYYAPGLTSRPAWKVMRHMLAGPNLGLIATRQTTEQWDVLPTKTLCGHKSCAAYDINSLFPLFLFQNDKTTDRQRLLAGVSSWLDREGDPVPNLSPEFVEEMEKRIGLRFDVAGHGRPNGTFCPKDIFHYTYALFHSRTYRTRFAEFLRIDYPRVLITSNRELFTRLVAIGADLVAFHLLDNGYLEASWNESGEESPLQHPSTLFVMGANDTTLGAFSKRTCYQNGRVYLDTAKRSQSSYYDGVPEEVWNFHIGGYQVCYKWLYDRRAIGDKPGRTLTPEDIQHYQRMVAAIQETIRIMGEIDEVIEAHGGWPIQ